MASFLEQITPKDFKEYFTRGFVYASVWDSSNIYNKGNIVYYDLTNLFYKCLNNDVSSAPTVEIDWDILAGNNYILDSDIQRAFFQAKGIFNINFYRDKNVGEMIFLYLTAHYLCIDFSLQGLNIGGSTGILTSKTVDDVSLHYGFPKKMLDNPLYAQLLRTGYGAKASSYIYANSIAKMYAVVSGRTTP